MRPLRVDRERGRAKVAASPKERLPLPSSGSRLPWLLAGRVQRGQLRFNKSVTMGGYVRRVYLAAR